MVLMMVIHINNIIEVEMNKLLLLTALLLSTLNAYHIYDAILQHQVRDINWPFTVCGDGSWEIKKLTLGGQPARNTNDDITITGKAQDDIDFKEAELTVKLNGVFLHNEKVDFGNSYSDGDTVLFKYTNFIPSFAPPGTYGLTFNFKTKTNKDNGCLEFSFKL